MSAGGEAVGVFMGGAGSVEGWNDWAMAWAAAMEAAAGGRGREGWKGWVVRGG